MWLKDLHNVILLSWSELKTSYGGRKKKKKKKRGQQQEGHFSLPESLHVQNVLPELFGRLTEAALRRQNEQNRHYTQLYSCVIFVACLLHTFYHTYLALPGL